MVWPTLRSRKDKEQNSDLGMEGWVWLGKRCMDYEVQGVRPRGRPKKTWSEVTEKDSHTQQLWIEDAMGRRKRKK